MHHLITLLYGLYILNTASPQNTVYVPATNHDPAMVFITAPQKTDILVNSPHSDTFQIQTLIIAPKNTTHVQVKQVVVPKDLN